MKKLIPLFFLIASSDLFAQNTRLDSLDLQLRKGDLNALFQIAKYFDSADNTASSLGYHSITSTESYVAKRIVKENTIFLDSEIIIDSTTSAGFIEFLRDNKEGIRFSNLANAFLLTDFDQKKTDFEILDLTKFRWSLLNSKRQELLKSDWVKENEIDRLVRAGDPLALLKTASAFLKHRSRFNASQDNRNEFIHLIQLLTRSQIVVPNESGRLSYYIENESNYQLKDKSIDESQINLLVFFAQNYKGYEWDESINAFRNKDLKIKPADKERELFDMLSSDDETIVQNAYISLSKGNAQRVNELIVQYRNSNPVEHHFSDNRSLKVLNQLVQLSDYSKKHKIDFEGGKALQNQIDLLIRKQSPIQRKKLEDSIIDELTLENITAFEYWSLIHAKNGTLNRSAERIVDKFYSKNWEDLIQDPNHLELYLLTSKLFNDISANDVGAIEFRKNYLARFRGKSKETRNSILNLNSTSAKVQGQIEKALRLIDEALKF